ncbi:MAG: DedA family protein [Myxococcaceae bacterium]
MVEWLDRILHAVGPAGYVVLFLAALVEYVFPPFPGDSVTLLGGIYAVRGEKPWPLVFLVVTTGSVVGSALDYFVGQRVARRVAQGKHTIGFTPERIAHLHARLGRKGPWLLVFNRFIPALRGMVFLGAGVVGIPLSRVLLLGGLSAALWNGLLMGAGIAVGGSAERLQAMVGRYNSVVYMILGVVGALVVGKLGYTLVRKRAALSSSSSKES